MLMLTSFISLKWIRYERIEKGNSQDNDNEYQLPQEWTESGVLAWLAKQVESIISVDSLDPNKDLFVQGLDR
jgi:hypothetical protein